jgi:S-formylglutathione hydrolase
MPTTAPWQPVAGLELAEDHGCFGGRQRVFVHQSAVLGCPMRFGLFMPPASAQADGGLAPLMIFLSGLTCTEQNFITKAGAQRVAAALGMAILTPDTSPRGLGLPGEDHAYDFGSGAGFYLDATQAPWAQHYRMESYITGELLDLVLGHFALDPRAIGLSGHSMGGHGALTLAFRHPRLFKSVSAIAPICAPAGCPWGRKAFMGYLGADEAAWADHDACALLKARGWKGDILIDQGADDAFLQEQLQPALFESTCQQTGTPLTLRFHEGYDHSYYFIATVIDDHVRWHADRAKVAADGA